MKTLAILLFLLVISSSESLGQRRFVVWSGDSGCGQKGSGIAADESITCVSFDTPRGKVSAINHDGLNFKVAFVEESNHLILATQIRNGNPHTIEFDSDTWGAAHFREATSGPSNGKLLLAETAIPSRDLVKGISSAVNMDSSTDTFMAGVSRQSEVREIRRPDGTRQKIVIITPDKDAQRIADDKNSSRRIITGSEQDKIRKSALTRKWLSAGDSTKGLVYFRRIKKASLVVFSLKVGDTTYVFRLPRNTHRTNPNSPSDS